jgi:hypothetical protein
MTALTDADLAMLTMERRFYTRPGGKEQAIADELGLTSTRYYQLLSGLINRPKALAADPVTVNRLRRLRARRRAA